MDVVLIILGVLGFGAIVISAYVFTVAARNYVSADERHHRSKPFARKSHRMIARSPVDRRSGEVVEFPLTVNGALVKEERRKLPERRLAG